MNKGIDLSKNDIKSLEQNIQYLSNKKDATEVFLEVIKTNILPLTANGSKSNRIEQFSLEKYSLIPSYNRTNYKRGEIAVHKLKNGYICKYVSEFSIEKGTEIGAIKSENGKNVEVVLEMYPFLLQMYRSPNGMWDNFTRNLELRVQQTEKFRNIMMIGDFNIDIV